MKRLLLTLALIAHASLAWAMGGAGGMTANKIGYAAPPTLGTCVTVASDPTRAATCYTLTITSASSTQLNDTGYSTGSAGLDPTKKYCVDIGPTTGRVITRTSSTIKGNGTGPGTGAIVWYGCSLQGGIPTATGGYIKRTLGTSNANYTAFSTCSSASAAQGMLAISGVQLFYAEGVRMNVQADFMGQNYGTDVWDLGANNQAIIFQHDRFENVWNIADIAGCSSGTNGHADCGQMNGSDPEQIVWIIDSTCRTGYQGFMTGSVLQSGNPSTADGRYININIRYMDPNYADKNAFGDAAAGGYLFSLDFGGAVSAPLSHFIFENVYIEPRANFGSSWCQNTLAPTCPTYSSSVNGDATKQQFVSTYVTTVGYVTQGNPPWGDFAPADIFTDATETTVIYASKYTSFRYPSPY